MSGAQVQGEGFLQAGGRHRARWWLVPLAAFLFTRALVFAGAYLPSALNISLIPPDVAQVGTESALDRLVRWDAQHYYRIITEGYRYVAGSADAGEATVAFFPLYPLAVRLLAPRGGEVAVGMLLSHAAFFAALLLLYRVTARAYHQRAAERAVLYLALFPSAFFFSMLYAESLFLLLVLASYDALQRGRWWWASWWAMLAGATRISGVFMMLYVALAWAQAQGWQLGRLHTAASWRALGRGLRQNPRVAAALLIMPLGVLAYMAYLQLTFGDGLAFLNARADAWGRDFLSPVGVIIAEVGAMLRGELKPHVLPYFDSVNIALFFAVLGLSGAIWRQLGAGAALYCLTSLFFAASVTTQSLNRHVLTYFPVFMVLGAWGARRPTLHRALVLCFAPLLMLFTALYVHWIFIG